MDAKVRDVSAGSSGKRRFWGDGDPGSMPAGGGGMRGRRRRARRTTAREGVFSRMGAERQTARSAASRRRQPRPGRARRSRVSCVAVML